MSMLAYVKAKPHSGGESFTRLRTTSVRQTTVAPFQRLLVLRNNYYLPNQGRESSSLPHLHITVLQCGLPDQKTYCDEKSHAFMTSLWKEKQEKPQTANPKFPYVTIYTPYTCAYALTVLPPYSSFAFKPKESTPLQKPQSYTYR